LKKILITGASRLSGDELVETLSKEYKLTSTRNVQALDPDSIRMDIVEKSR